MLKRAVIMTPRLMEFTSRREILLLLYSNSKLKSRRPPERLHELASISWCANLTILTSVDLSPDPLLISIDLGPLKAFFAICQKRAPTYRSLCRSCHDFPEWSGDFATSTMPTRACSFLRRSSAPSELRTAMDQIPWRDRLVLYAPSTSPPSSAGFLLIMPKSCSPR